MDHFSYVPTRAYRKSDGSVYNSLKLMKRMLLNIVGSGAKGMGLDRSGYEGKSF